MCAGEEEVTAGGAEVRAPNPGGNRGGGVRLDEADEEKDAGEKPWALAA